LIGVLGGTFAPIHNAHLRLAIEAREQLGLSEVRLIPAAQPALRAAPAASAARRLRWVKLAIREVPGLVADDRELRRRGTSYTIDTLAALRAEHRRTPICFVLGQDAARQLPQWHRWQALLEHAHLAVFNRPGVDPELPAAVARLLRERAVRSAAALRRRPAGLCWRGAMPPLPISASDVRRRLRAGLSVRGLVPDAVIDDFTRKDLEALARA
jgi:nicotinate-nucleotide adenylyltransferase